MRGGAVRTKHVRAGSYFAGRPGGSLWKGWYLTGWMCIDRMIGAAMEKAGASAQNIRVRSDGAHPPGLRERSANTESRPPFSCD